MRVVHSAHHLPRDWSGLPGADRALLIAEIAILPRSRLRLKLLVFRTNRDLVRFWSEGLERPHLGRGTLGAVHSLSFENHYFPAPGKPGKAPYLEADPRYFAVMGIVQSALCMEVITHESVHAAYAYAVRTSKRWPNHDNPEERICYPAGRIAERINQAVHAAGLYPH